MAVQKVYSLRIQSRTDRGQRALAWGPTKPHTLPFQERGAPVIAPCRSSSQQMSAPSSGSLSGLFSPTLTTQTLTCSCSLLAMSNVTIEVPNPVIVVSDENFEVPELVVRNETEQPSSPSAPPSPMLRAQDDSYLTPYMNTDRPDPPRRPRSAPPGKLIFEDEFREFAVTTAVRPVARLPLDLLPPPPPLCTCLYASMRC